MSAFYLLPTCLAGWVAGRLAGFAVGALCTGAWFLSDMFNGAAYQSSADSRLECGHAFYILFGCRLVTDGVPRSHYHLEQTVERRTAALRAEMEERKRLEHANLQAERLAVVGSMAAQVAHEIRNPLGVNLAEP